MVFCCRKAPKHPNDAMRQITMVAMNDHYILATTCMMKAAGRFGIRSLSGTHSAEDILDVRLAFCMASMMVTEKKA